MNLWNQKISGRFLQINQTIKRQFSINNEKNYYDVLGVSRTATQQEIKRAFYNLSKKYHPDVVGSDSKRFIEIKEAYDTLKDEDKRKLYDSGYDNIGFDPFGNQRSYSDFSKSSYKNARRSYEFRHNHHYTQEEIDRIWKQFQEQIRNRVNTEYDEEMRRRAREKQYNDFIKKRMYRWQEYTREQDKKNSYPNPSYGQGWDVFRRIVVVYFCVFTMVALFRVVSGPRNEERVIITNEPNEQSAYLLPKDKIQRMMEKPPVNFDEEENQIDPNYPYGFPTYDKKD